MLYHPFRSTRKKNTVHAISWQIVYTFYIIDYIVNCNLLSVMFIMIPSSMFFQNLLTPPLSHERRRYQTIKQHVMHRKCLIY